MIKVVCSTSLSDQICPALKITVIAENPSTRIIKGQATCNAISYGTVNDVGIIRNPKYANDNIKGISENKNTLPYSIINTYGGA